MTKAALDKYAYSLGMELQLLGIKVSVLRAGAVETSMLGVSTASLRMTSWWRVEKSPVWAFIELFTAN